jgi:hypothetical protein
MRRLRIVICSLLAVMSFTLTGVAFGDVTNILADKALRVSGMAGQLENLGPALISAVPEDLFPNSRFRGNANAFVKKTAGKGVLFEIVRSAVCADADQETLEKVIAFYDSRLGRKVRRLNETALEPAMLKNIREGREVLAASNESRLATLRRIIAADHTSETNKALLKAWDQGLLDGYGAVAANTSNDGKTVQQRMKRMDEAIGADERGTEQISLTAYACTYRSLDDKELEELATFRESPSATRFSAAVRNGLKEAVYKVAKSFAEAITREKASSGSGDSGRPLQ